jgi:hypothetical protein
MLDPGRLGLAGHSYGAAGVSYIGQWDPRVDAIVAWDNLGTPDPNKPFGGNGGGPVEKPCPSDPNARKPAQITKPALGMSADYFIPPEPNTSDPDPLAKSTTSRQYSKEGVDTGELIIRGGTHYDFDWVPNPGFPATLRGADMIDWYTTAWFDKYVKGDCTADRRLLTNRWRTDKAEAAIDQPNHDGNMFSWYYRSRLDFHLADGSRYVNENVRDNGSGLTKSDGYAGEYSFLPIARSADKDNTSFGACPAQPGLRVTVRPKRARAGRRTRFTIVVTAAGRPVRGARVGFAHRKARTNSRGVARITTRLNRAGMTRARAARPGYRRGHARVRVLRASR